MLKGIKTKKKLIRKMIAKKRTVVNLTISKSVSGDSSLCLSKMQAIKRTIEKKLKERKEKIA